MRLLKPLYILVPLVAVILFGSANPDPYPDDYFVSPVGIDLRLAGSFAEMRSNHFHSGLDIKTNGRPGYRVYSAADGWISRISVSPSGFGNALYVTHPNGYMTVYAHLDRFEEPIASFVRDLQYRQERFDVQYFPERDDFPVTIGDVIAYSGNSGSSSGPHLHFEVRDVRSGWALNPLLFNFDVLDTTPPRIYRLKVYADEDGGRVKLHDGRTGGVRVLGSGESALLDVTRSGDSYRLDRVDLIETEGAVRFGLQTHDYHEGSNNRLGAFRISLNADDEKVFQSVLERFSFDQTRYINAHVDFEERSRSGRWVQRSHVLPGNQLPIYETTQGGLLEFAPGESRTMKYVVEDIRGNSARLEFKVAGIAPDSTQTSERPGSPFILRHDAPFSMARTGATLRIPAGAVYRDQPFEYSLSRDRPADALADVHRIHDHREPVHRAYSLSLAVGGSDLGDTSQLTLASVQSNGALRWAGGSYENGAVTGSLRAFGSYTVAADREPPTVRLLNMSDGSDMSHRNSIRVRISDNFSGIASYTGRIDGKWVLFEYDAKYGLLTHTFDERIPAGSHELELTATDNVGNTRTVTTRFTR